MYDIPIQNQKRGQQHVEGPLVSLTGESYAHTHMSQFMLSAPLTHTHASRLTSHGEMVHTHTNNPPRVTISKGKRPRPDPGTSTRTSPR